MRPVEAARVLWQSGDQAQARAILEHLWNSPERGGSDEFGVFCALMEIWAIERPSSVFGFIEQLISGEGELQPFWERRTMAEQATLLEWHGQLAFHAGDKNAAFDSLTRAASLGRDTAVVWRLVGVIHVEREDLELGLRYLRRSLQLHRQLELDLLSGRDNPLGYFTGQSLVPVGQGAEDFLKILLDVTRLAKNQRNLKSVREMVIELIHQYPREEKLMKVRLLLERAIVQGSVLPSPGPVAALPSEGFRAGAVAAARPAAEPVLSRQAAHTKASLARPRGLSALFRA